MAVRTNTDQWFEKWGRKTKASGQDMRDGINRVMEAPGIKAAQASDRMLAGITEAITSGKWGRAVSKVSLQDWKDSMLDKGVGRVSAGVDQAANTKRAAIDKLLQDVDSASDSVRAMPNASFQDRLSRMTQFATLMHEKSQQG